MPTATTMTRAERNARLEEGLCVAMALSDDKADMRALLDKVRDLSHEYRDGRLFVGSGARPKWELRESKNATHYCKCPDFAFKQRPGRAGSYCKHLYFALALGLDIPKTEDLDARAAGVDKEH